MNSLREWDITFGFYKVNLLHDFLLECTITNNGWGFPENESQEYQLMHDGPAGFATLAANERHPEVTVAIASKTKLATRKERRNACEGPPKHPVLPREYKVYNIIPTEPGWISPRQYNDALEEFDYGTRLTLKRLMTLAKISFSSEKIGLHSIISGTKCRHQFETYLKGFPRTFHPSDLLQLDRFTGLVSRHRCKVNIYQLAEYLEVDLGWTPEDAKTVVNRVEIGLEVLQANRR